MKYKICNNPNCIHGGKPQPITNFYKFSEHDDGLYNQCKDCIKEQHKIQRNKNKEKIKKQKHEYYEKNKDVISKKNKNYVINHREKIKTYKKRFANQLATVEKFLDKLRIYYDENELRIDPENPQLIQVRCKNNKCQKWFNPTNQQVYNRFIALNNFSHGESHFYCSENCKKTCKLFGTRSIDINLNDDDVIKKEKSNCEYTELLQIELRNIVFERDNWTCQKCGKSKQDYPDLKFFCHHIISRKIEPIFSSDLDNCITLCEKCHHNIHKQSGCTPQDIHKQINKK